MGDFIDRLGRQTAAGRWLWFVTLTFWTPHYPWARGFPVEQPQPCSDFVHHFLERMISWIEREVHARVEYFAVDQFGTIGGRLHQHLGLSWPSLFEYRWKQLQKTLWDEAGFNRILPWKMDAAYYIGRYIGRDAERCHWDFRVGRQAISAPLPVGHQVLASSRVPEASSVEVLAQLGVKAGYRSILRRPHR